MDRSLHDVVKFLDQYLDIHAVKDASLNGLQLEAATTVNRVGVAVDAAAATIGAAIDAQCDLLLVHHGLLFGGPQRLTGALGRNLAACFDAGLSVYAAHLPLDIHAEVGNNVLLAAALGAQPSGSFGAHDGSDLGVLATLPQPTPLAELAGTLAAAGCDQQVMWAFGSDPLRRLAILTGSGCFALQEAIAAGAGCFITGEPRQSAYHQAREGNINCLFGGHYATEVFGVRAVGERLASHFGLPCTWIDHPTGV